MEAHTRLKDDLLATIDHTKSMLPAAEGASSGTVTFCEKGDLAHMVQGHGPNGKQNSTFDITFLQQFESSPAEAMGKLADYIFKNGVGEAEPGGDGGITYKYYVNFQRKTGTDSVTSKDYKGAVMVGRLSESGSTFHIKTVYPRGWLKKD